jgi:hypothetical protein
LSTNKSMRLRNINHKATNNHLLLCSPIIIKRDQRSHHRKDKNGQMNKHIFVSKLLVKINLNGI